MSYSLNDNTMNNTYIGDPLSVSTGTAGQVYTTTGTGNLYWGNLIGYE